MGIRVDVSDVETPEVEDTEGQDTEEAAAIEENESIETETDSEETEESDESATSEESEESEEDEGKPQRTSGVKKRIGRLKRKLSEKDRDIEYWKAQALKNQGNKEPETEAQAVTPQENGKPRSDDYDTQADYLEALTDWKVDQRMQKSEQMAQADQEKNHKVAAAQAWSQKVQEFEDNTPDFEEVLEMAPDVTLPAYTQEAIIESDLGPRILYELAKDPAEAMRIASIKSPLAAAREVGKLEAKFSMPSEKKTVVKTNKTTKAPPPNSNLKGNATVEKDPNTMTFSEYEAWHAKKYG
jgi:hypothetical protein